MSHLPPAPPPPRVGGGLFSNPRFWEVVLPHPRRLVFGTLGAALFAAALWFVWFDWDDNDHQTWQTLGLVASLVLLTVGFQLVVRGVFSCFVLPFAVAAGFTTAWSVDAAAEDPEGIYPFFAMMMMIGIPIGLGVVLAVVVPIAAALRRNRAGFKTNTAPQGQPRP